MFIQACQQFMLELMKWPMQQLMWWLNDSRIQLAIHVKRLLGPIWLSDRRRNKNNKAGSLIIKFLNLNIESRMVNLKSIHHPAFLIKLNRENFSLVKRNGFSYKIILLTELWLSVFASLELQLNVPLPHLCVIFLVLDQFYRKLSW